MLKRLDRDNKCTYKGPMWDTVGSDLHKKGPVQDLMQIKDDITTSGDPCRDLLKGWHLRINAGTPDTLI